MEHTALEYLIKTKQTVIKDGIYVDQKIAEKTVWDKLAVENPTHAVISAKDEATALKKSKEQIADLKRHLKPDDILLDCGTGYGRVAKYLLPEIPLKGYVGVDSAYQMLQLFKSRYEDSAAEQRTPVAFINSDINDMPVVDESIDKAIVSAVYLHNHKSVVKDAVTDLTRVLKPGGKVIVYSSFPCSPNLMALQGHAYQGLLNLLGRPYKNGPVRYYSRREVAKLFENYNEVDIIPVGYALLPKSIIIFPSFLDKIWLEVIARPINTLLEKITPTSLKPYFAMHFDVVATK
jgi:ubiquinone/menaquinone biosynthesis C-methylase UbiE